MSKLLILAAAVVITGGELPNKMDRVDTNLPEAIVIQESVGGRLSEALLTRPFVVDGPCASGCGWALLINDKACFTPRARVRLEAFRDPGTGEIMQAANEYWLSRIPLPTRLALGAYLASAKLSEPLDSISLNAVIPWKRCEATQ